MMDKLEENSDNYEKVVDQHIKYYAEKVTKYTRIHNTLQLIIIFGSITLPFLIGNAGMINVVPLPKWLPIFISLIVAITAGIDGYFKFGETCAKFRSACQLITREKRLYNYRIGLYHNFPDDHERLSKFKNQVEEHMSELYPSKDDRTPGQLSTKTNMKSG